MFRADKVVETLLNDRPSNDLDTIKRAFKYFLSCLIHLDIFGVPVLFLFFEELF